jgi:hypothetical protein
MTDPFEALIQQLSAELKIKLQVDRNHACALKIHHKLTVQLQIDTALEKVLIASLVSEIPPGRFRENVLAEALKANNLPDPRTGILGYLSTGNRLTLHQRYPLATLDGKKLADLVAGFIDYADLWHEAIEKGQSSPAPIHGSKGSPNPFGLQR